MSESYLDMEARITLDIDAILEGICPNIAVAAREYICPERHLRERFKNRLYITTVLALKHIFGALKHKHVRASARSGLNRAATLPTSGFTAVDSLTGASRPASELSARLDAALDQIDIEDINNLLLSLLCLRNMRIIICR